MNTRSKILAALLCAFAVTLFFTVTATPAFAQAASDTSSALIAPDTAAAIAQPFVVTLAARFPAVLTMLVVIGALRFFFKPVMSLVEAYVRSTPSTADDALIDKVNHSGAFKVFAWLLDFGASIKVGPQFTAQPDKK